VLPPSALFMVDSFPFDGGFCFGVQQTACNLKSSLKDIKFCPSISVKKDFFGCQWKYEDITIMIIKILQYYNYFETLHGELNI
jgi:hypothetical protein